MKLSVIIVNYNVRHFLEQCLQSVNDGLKHIEGEVIVVDNNSVDGSQEMIRSKFPEVRLIPNKVNAGFSKANNQAIRQSTAEYVLLLNPDTVVQEDSFTKCVEFMDKHDDAGGLGVYMINGKGGYLPESKRGLPTPSVAFYKISGLSRLFPKSKLFGQYHLGYLDRNSIHKVDVLSGAFMMLRRSVLDQTGLLDEDFFMYGEDIDLSYRITKAGYNNYYFPETRIIHYKGESTKKSSVNYVVVFYRAMLIFATKHFSSSSAGIFSILINFAIFLRAGLAILGRVTKRLFLPFAESVLFFTGMYFLTEYWETSIKELNYPPVFMYLVVPVYCLIWITAIFLSGGYDRPLKISKSVKGIFSGTILILIVYALLSEEYRFSRALILLGTTWAVLVSAFLRLLFDTLGFRDYKLARNENKRILLVGDEIECKRVLSILQISGIPFDLIGFISPLPDQNEKKDSDFSRFNLGRLDDLEEILEVYQVNEVIFCAKNISSQEIINKMLLTGSDDIEYKIAPPESPFIIGSNYLDDQGDVYLLNINAINTPVNRRNKRLFDVIASLSVLFIFPVLAFIVRKPINMISNSARVLSGSLSWVGVSSYLNVGMEGANQTTSMKKGVLAPSDGLKFPVSNDTVSGRLDLLYARDYTWEKDLRIMTRSLRQLGRRV